MKGYLDPSGTHVLRLDRGEQVRATVEAYARRAGITGARVQGIGTVKDPELGFFWFGLPWWMRRNRTYRRRVIPGVWELAAFTGNLSLRDGDPFLHAHAVLGGPLFRARAGHLFEATIAVTGEMFLYPLSSPLPREPDEDIGFQRWCPTGAP